MLLKLTDLLCSTFNLFFKATDLPAYIGGTGIIIKMALQ
jgi:hypothetical protein